MADSPSNKIPFVPENTIDPAAGLNLAIDVIDALLNTRVENMTTNAPPGSPADGVMYVVGPAPTGAWAGHAKAFARYVAEGSFWQFYEGGEEAWLVLNKADGNLYKWDTAGSSWVAAAGIGDAPNDGQLYGRKSLSWFEMPDVSHVVLSVNGETPDSSGNVEVSGGGDVQTVNDQSPDSAGNVEIQAIDIPFTPDSSSGLVSTNVEDAINEAAANSGGGGGSSNQWEALATFNFATDGAKASIEANVTDFSEILMVFDGVTLASSGYRGFQTSIDGGSTWLTTASYDYIADNTGTIATSTLPGGALHGTATTSARYAYSRMSLFGSGRTIATMSGNVSPQSFFLRDLGSPINRIRIGGIPPTVGALINMNGGKAYIYGLKK